MTWISAFKLYLDIFTDWLYCLVYFMSWTSAFKLFLDILFNDLDLGVQAFSSFFLDIFEPLEGPDTLDVLLDLNDSVHIRTYPNYPGFRHRFVRLYVIFCVDSCSRSTCRHVDPFKKGLTCLLYTSPSPRDGLLSRMPSSA